ncbi:MAG: methyltransferase domain-containing protein [Chloroflexi bacterium]|nr:methyltransferase domain-containing protein [Chloroflexota bacterium]
MTNFTDNAQTDGGQIDGDQIDGGQDVDPVPTPWRVLGRQLLANELIFDFGSWAYAWMTGNPIWHANSARLLESVPPGQESFQVLNLGAGPGNSALAMGKQHPEANLIAFDLAQQMLALAVERRAASGWPLARLTPVLGDALYLPFADASIDMVTGHSFLYLLPDYQGVLREACRVLRPGGQVAFLEPHIGPVDWAWLWQQASLPLLTSLSLWRVYSWFHRRFSAQRLQKALVHTGFHNVRTEVTLGGFGIFGRGQKR